MPPRSISSSSSRRRNSTLAFCRWSSRPAGSRAARGWTSSASACSPTIVCVRSIDYPDASDVFPGVGLKGGICYFLWDRDNAGPVQCHDTFQGRPPRPRPAVARYLEAYDVFIRLQRGLSILKKVVAVESGQLRRSDGIVLSSSTSRSGLATTSRAS